MRIDRSGRVIARQADVSDLSPPEGCHQDYPNEGGNLYNFRSAHVTEVSVGDEEDQWREECIQVLAKSQTGQRDHEAQEITPRRAVIEHEANQYRDAD